MTEHIKWTDVLQGTETMEEVINGCTVTLDVREFVVLTEVLTFIKRDQNDPRLNEVIDGFKFTFNTKG